MKYYYLLFVSMMLFLNSGKSQTMLDWRQKTLISESNQDYFIVSKSFIADNKYILCIIHTTDNLVLKKSTYIEYKNPLFYDTIVIDSQKLFIVDHLEYKYLYSLGTDKYAKNIKVSIDSFSNYLQNPLAHLKLTSCNLSIDYGTLVRSDKNDYYLISFVFKYDCLVEDAAYLMEVGFDKEGNVKQIQSVNGIYK